MFICLFSILSHPLIHIFFHQLFILPPKTLITVNLYHQRISKICSAENVYIYNRSVYTNTSTVEIKVIGGLFIFFCLFTFTSYSISLEMAYRCLRAICGRVNNFIKIFFLSKYFYARINILTLSIIFIICVMI